MDIMDEPFPDDIDINEEHNHSGDGCDFDNDYDNQKLFAIYETYLNKTDISDTETEPDLSLSDEFFQMFDKKVTRTPVNRTARNISCFDDIKNRTPRMSRLSCVSNRLDFSDDSVCETTELPFNLNDMSEQEIVDLIHKLDEEISVKEKEYPQLSADRLKELFGKQIQLFKQVSEESENQFQNSLHKINSKAAKERFAFEELIGKELADIGNKSKQLATHLSDLNVVRQISGQ